MKDKNGIEIRTGSIVEITGAYFKKHNGLYFVEYSPGDPSWNGSDYCLKRISKTGGISKAKGNICFWPITITLNDRTKAEEAREWNRGHARIEVKTIKNMDEVSVYFQSKADKMEGQIRRIEWDFGADSDIVKENRIIQAHYRNIAQTVLK